MIKVMSFVYSLFTNVANYITVAGFSWHGVTFHMEQDMGIEPITSSLPKKCSSV